MPTFDEILTAFVAICPDFKKRWEEEKDDWSDDNGLITFCGLFSIISRFERENFARMPPQQQKQLMRFIESCTIAEGEDDTELDTAVCTCFLENLAGEPPLSAQLRTYMGPNSLAFFNFWDYPSSN